MPDKPTVAVALMIPFFKYLEGKGISPEKICSAAGIDTNLLKSPDQRFTLDELNRINIKAMEMTGDKIIGFHTGSAFTLGNAGIVGYLMMNCSTIGEAFEKYCSYQELPGDIVRIKLSIGKTHARFHWEYNPETMLFSSLIMESVSAAVLAMIKELSGQNLPLTEAHFSYPKPDNFSEYKKFYKCEIKFEEPETALIFDKKYLDIPVKNPNRQLLEIMEKYAVEYLKSFHKSYTISERVQKLLKVFHGIIPGINLVAAELGMTVRGLQKKLKDEGNTFKTLRESVQRELAVDYVKNSHYSISEISKMLGFSEPCVFHRTFKRWTGFPPGKYRNT